MRMVWCLALVLLVNPAIANTSADSILSKVRDREDGRDYICDVKLKTYFKGGNTRIRESYMLQKDLEGKEISTIFFYAPADVRNVAFQTISYKENMDKNDDQRIYFPAFRKIRRISTEDKRGSFMGSMFSYIDLDKVRVSDYKSRLISEEIFDKRPVWIIERIPESQDVINKTGYYKSKVWVDRERMIILRQQYFDAKGVIFKEQVSTDVKKVQDIWTVMTSEMLNHDNGTRSEMIFSNMKYNVGIGNKYFTRRALKTGYSKSDISQLRQ